MIWHAAGGEIPGESTGQRRMQGGAAEDCDCGEGMLAEGLQSRGRQTFS